MNPSLFIKKRFYEIKLILGILFGCLLLQTAARGLTDFATVLLFSNVSPVEWRADISHLPAGNYYAVIGRPQGVCDVKVDDQIWDSNRSGHLDIRSHLFLGFALPLPFKNRQPQLISVSCLPQEGFSMSFYKTPVIMHFSSGVISILFQEIYTMVMGPVFSFFLICSIFLTTTINRRKLKLNNYFLSFGICAFFYSISLAHVTSLFWDGPAYTFFHIFIRICFSLSFILLCGNYSRQRRLLIFLHFLLILGLLWNFSSPANTVNFYYSIYLFFPLVSGIAFYDLFKLENPTKFEGFLAAIAGSWSIFQLRDMTALKMINGYYSGPLMISLVTGFLAYFNYQQALESEEEAETLKTELEVKSAIADLSMQVAHDIRSPLAFLKVIQEDQSFSPQMKNNLGSVVSRLNGIVDGLSKKNRVPKNLKQGEPFRGTDEDLSKVDLKETATKLIHEKQITLGSDCQIKFELKTQSLKPYTVFVQRVELERMISNILNNSIEAIIGKGLVTVEIGESDKGVFLSIVDTGTGIRPEALKLLGERGRTFGKVGGNGLGLFHAKNTIESWKGQLEILAEEKAGTSVKLVFSVL